MNAYPLLGVAICMAAGAAHGNPLWRISDDRAPFALAPGNYGDFLDHFGRPENAFYVGLSDPGRDFPYVLPGPLDGWAGSHYGAKGFNAWDLMNTIPIGFVLKAPPPAAGTCALTLDLRDTAPDLPPRLRITVNDDFVERQLIAGGSDDSLKGRLDRARPQSLRIEFPAAWLRPGYNEISLRSTAGHWCIFRSIALDTPAQVALAPAASTVVRSLTAATHAVSSDPAQPAAIRLEVYQAGSAESLAVSTGRSSRSVIAEPGLQVLEVPAGAQPQARVQVSAHGTVLAEATLDLEVAPGATPADYVNVFAGTAHSRWMLAPGPWMPFGMVKLAPDNQMGSWCAGYDTTIESIDCFSHVHEFTMAGLGMMPTVGSLRTHEGLDPEGFSSPIDKRTEHGGIGSYDVLLQRGGIHVELTATTRASLQRYTFPASDEARILYPFLLPNEYELHIHAARVRRTGPAEIEGEIESSIPKVYDCDQHFVLHFVCQFSRPFLALGGWENLQGAEVTIPRGRRRPAAETPDWHGGTVTHDAAALDESGDCGAFVTFQTAAGEAISVRTGISLVSTANARANLDQELARPFGWNFAAVVAAQRRAWNQLFGRIQIETPNARERSRFYTNFYRALSGRNTWSDVNGEWMDPGGRVQRPSDPRTVMMGSDALWGTYWNLNQLMNLAAPEWSARWVRSELEMYDKCGWLAKGPAGLKYISIMVAEHEIPLLVAAYQSGIPDLDGEKILAASVKMQNTPRTTVIGHGKVGNEQLPGYLKYGYVPADGPLRGNTSNTCEYAYDDWTVGQLARKLGHEDLAATFLRRGESWRNSFDPQLGLIRPRRADGSWVTPFDPYHTRGYTEGNSVQYTWFVPQNPGGLIGAMGRDRFISRLNAAFVRMAPVRFNAAGGVNADYPLDHGNEPTMHVAWLFNWAGRPDLTQRWTREILDRYYGFNPADAYPGDDDQGEMSSWFVLASMGLFQLDGGCDAHPIYELSDPLYPQITLNGGSFTISAPGVSARNRFIQSARLNGQPLQRWWLRQDEVRGGGHLEFVMGSQPNPGWASAAPLPPR